MSEIAAFADMRMYTKRIIRLASIIEADAQRPPARYTINQRAQEIEAIATRLMDRIKHLDPDPEDEGIE